MAQDNSIINLGVLPTGLISNEISGIYGSEILQDMKKIIELYKVYENGADFTPDTTKDYMPAQMHVKQAKSLIDKEARFLFSRTPDHWVESIGTGGNMTEKEKADLTVYQELLDKVLLKNGFSRNLMRGAKDAFIGKRVAVLLNFNNDTGITISFVPSIGFVYDVDPTNIDKLTKIVAFYAVNDEQIASSQRIYKKKYYMENGFCRTVEELYDGSGRLIETITPDSATPFTYIPAVVIVNDGLTGDLKGESEIESLMEYESWLSRMTNADLDAERKSMNPIRYTIDCSPESTKGLSISAGAYWDLSTDQTSAMDAKGAVGTLPSETGYASALEKTVARIRQSMYEQVAVPNVSPDAMQGVVSSGKTLKAIYWDLSVRCDEKMLTWRPALEFIDRCIIEGAQLFPAAARFYISGAIPNTPFSVRVDNQYSLPEDEAEEKQTDLAEIVAQTMSRRSYLKKWRNLTDTEVDEELKQIAREREILEDSFSGTQQTQPGMTEESEE